MQNFSDVGINKDSTNSHAGDSHVVCELKKTLSDIEELVKSSSSTAGNDLVHLNEKIKNRINLANETFGVRKASLVNRLRDTSARTNNYVHDQPWKAVGAGVAIGTLCGVLFALGKMNKQP